MRRAETLLATARQSTAEKHPLTSTQVGRRLAAPTIYWGPAMADRLEPGAPYRVLQLEGGQTAPFYVIPFDKDGVCTGPLTAANLVDVVSRDAPTDVFVYSHGWNNAWSDAIGLYDDFVDGFVALRAKHPPGTAFRPVLVGVFWPSIALVVPGERAPDIASVGAGADGAPGQDDTEVALERAEIDAVAGVVPAAQRERFYALAQRPGDLDADESAEFAALVAAAFAGTDELRTVDAVPAADVLELWRAAPAGGRPVGDDFGFADDQAGGPQAAGLLAKLDPRNLVRLATVLLMKDRADRVGGRGVSGLLSSLLAAGDARVHLIGHSYGAKVLLSAVAAAPVSRNVDSVLLLQPAMSHLCFAPDADGEGHPGGYRNVLSRTRQPIMTTFSRHDLPLTKLFHLAARRKSDLGEVQIAGAPSRYAALGGFGPSGIDGEALVVSARLPSTPYDVPPAGVRIMAIESSDVIGGHSDVANEATHWMLLNQLSRVG